MADNNISRLRNAAVIIHLGWIDTKFFGTCFLIDFTGLELHSGFQKKR
jgi:hypothetical protein